MLTEVNGLPTHPLLVHAAVVFVPLTLVATILIVARASWRRSLGWWVVLLSAASVGFVVLAKESGEHLADVVGLPISHAALGDGLPYFAAAQFVMVTVYVAAAALVDRSRSQRDSSASLRTGAATAESLGSVIDGSGAATSPAGSTRSATGATRMKMPLAVRVLAGLAIFVGLIATIQTVRVGDSGAQAVWAGELAAAQTTPSPSARPTGSASAVPSSADPSPTSASPTESTRTPSSATRSAAASPTPSAAATTQVFTATEVAQHDRRSDCYTIINGKVYDLTGWIAANPQGSAQVVALCGIDGTSVYLDQTDSPLTRAELAQLQIGVTTAQ